MNSEKHWFADQSACEALTHMDFKGLDRQQGAAIRSSKMVGCTQTQKREHAQRQKLGQEGALGSPGEQPEGPR